MNQTENNFYEPYGVEWASTFRKGVEQNDTDYKMENLLTLIKDADPRCVVDFGCGLGNALAHMRERFPQADLIGVDISLSMIEQARKDHPQIRFIHGSPDNQKAIKADIVTFIFVLEHLEEIPHALCAARTCVHYIGFEIPLEKTWFIELLNRLSLKRPQRLAFESEGHLYEFKYLFSPQQLSWH